MNHLKYEMLKKAQKVADSCETEEQRRVAIRFVELCRGKVVKYSPVYWALDDMRSKLRYEVFYKPFYDYISNVYSNEQRKIIVTN